MGSDNNEISDVLGRIARLPEDWHHHGVMSTGEIRAITRYLEPGPILHSMKTGIAQTSLLLSHLSQSHLVFTMGDSGMYPFPELDTGAYIHMSPGAILVIDDIHIPNIDNMFRFLREDDMFELEVVRATAFLRRTSGPCSIRLATDGIIRTTHAAGFRPMFFGPRD